MHNLAKVATKAARTALLFGEGRLARLSVKTVRIAAARGPSASIRHIGWRSMEDDYEIRKAEERARAGQINYVRKKLNEGLKRLPELESHERTSLYPYFHMLAELCDYQTTDEFLPKLRALEEHYGSLTFWEEWKLYRVSPTFSSTASKYCDDWNKFFCGDIAETEADKFYSKPELIQIIRAFLASQYELIDLNETVSAEISPAIDELKALCTRAYNPLKEVGDSDSSFTKVAKCLDGKASIDDKIQTSTAQVQILGRWLRNNIGISNIKGVKWIEDFEDFLEGTRELKHHKLLMGPPDINEALRLIDLIEARKTHTDSSATVFHQSVHGAVVTPAHKEVFGVKGDNTLNNRAIADLEAILELKKESIEKDFSREEFDRRLNRIGISRFGILRWLDIFYEYRYSSKPIEKLLAKFKSEDYALNESNAYNFFTAVVACAKSGDLSMARYMAEEKIEQYPTDERVAFIYERAMSPEFPGNCRGLVKLESIGLEL